MAPARFAWLLAATVALACAPKPAEPRTAEPNRHAQSAPRAHAHDEHSAHRPPKGHGDHGFDDVEGWAKVFDHPERDGWQKPDDVVRELGLAPSDVVADLGAGTGYFVSRLSRAVPNGKVLAVEVEPQMITFLRQRAARENVRNMTTVLATDDDPKLPERVNVVFLVDTYHHISNRTPYFRKVRGRLAPAGRVVIVDFKMGKLPVGPPDEHKIAPERVKSEMEAAGYVQCKSYDGLPHQYMLTFAERC
jgi:SAM-dependent methyltransferase